MWKVLGWVQGEGIDLKNNAFEKAIIEESIAVLVMHTGWTKKGQHLVISYEYGCELISNFLTLPVTQRFLGFFLFFFNSWAI